VDPAHTVDHATFNPMDIIFLSPLERLLKTPITAIECIRVKTNFDHILCSPAIIFTIFYLSLLEYRAGSNLLA
jgi:hypothetical protein